MVNFEFRAKKGLLLAEVMSRIEVANTEVLFRSFSVEVKI